MDDIDRYAVISCNSGACGMKMSSDDGKWCKHDEVSRRVGQLKQELDEARVMVLRLVVARYRQGWEQGDSEEEVHDLALSKLGGWELDPCNNRSECEKILGFKIEDPE